jgi:hypothetical protein
MSAVNKGPCGPIHHAKGVWQVHVNTLVAPLFWKNTMWMWTTEAESAAERINGRRYVCIVLEVDSHHNSPSLDLRWLSVVVCPLHQRPKSNRAKRVDASDLNSRCPKCQLRPYQFIAAPYHFQITSFIVSFQSMTGVECSANVVVVQIQLR